MALSPHIARLPALAPGGAAVITGAASGIGRAAAETFAAAGLKVVMADRSAEALARAAEEIGKACGRPGEVIGVETDVASFDSVAALRDRALAAFGPPNVLMNNAGVGHNPGGVAQDLEGWRRLIGVNFWGVEHGLQAFVPHMRDGAARMIINTGSKQGITTPPGNAAYNVSKAAVKALTEALAYELRQDAGCRTTAHLMIPGFTYTGMTGRAEKPPGAWSAQQAVDFMLERLAAGDFYILCPDNDVDRRTDEKRMAWAVGDIIENRPALSRWHPDYAEAFKAFMAKD